MAAERTVGKVLRIVRHCDVGLFALYRLGKLASHSMTDVQKVKG